MAEENDVAVLAASFPVEWREPTLESDEVRAWEVEHGVELPEPYRSFITEVSNGSSFGPPDDGGLLPLGWSPAGFPTADRNPAAVFPLTATWFWEEDAAVDQTQVAAVFSDGSVVLGASDGPLYWLLVVSGPQRGTVWAVSEVGAVRLEGPEGAVGFAEWVAGWKADPDGFLEAITAE